MNNTTSKIRVTKNTTLEDLVKWNKDSIVGFLKNRINTKLPHPGCGGKGIREKFDMLCMPHIHCGNCILAYKGRTTLAHCKSLLNKIKEMDTIKHIGCIRI